MARSESYSVSFKKGEAGEDLCLWMQQCECAHNIIKVQTMALDFHDTAVHRLCHGGFSCK